MQRKLLKQDLNFLINRFNNILKIFLILRFPNAFFKNFKHTQNEKMAETKSTFDRSKCVLRVKYRVHYEDHSGYCSDPYNMTEKDVTECELIKLPDWLDVNEEDVSVDGKLLSKEKIGDHFPTEKWFHGNGYCGCRCFRKFVSAKLIAK